MSFKYHWSHWSTLRSAFELRPFLLRMALIGVTGSRKAIDRALMSYALVHTPAVVVDCGNVANIRVWFSQFPFAQYDRVFVYELELLYKFRDALLVVDTIAEQERVQCIVVTSTGHLFHYQNHVENYEVYDHAWSVLAALGKRYEVRVALDSKLQRHFAQRYGAQLEQHMGHTVSSQRIDLEQMIGELEGYARALRKEERALFNDLLRVPMRHVGSVSSANSLHAWSFLLLSIMIEQERRLRQLEKHAGLVDRRIPHEQQHRLMVEN